MEIVKNKAYRIKGESSYFLVKYGTANPIIIIEDTDVNVFGVGWARLNNNPTCILFAMRALTEKLPAIKDTVYYGKISIGEGRGGLGELVCASELEVV
jgi:hypothetical protein